MPVAPEAVVEAPMPGPLNGSLLQTFAPEANPDDRWTGGVLWTPEPNGVVEVTDICDFDTDDPEHTTPAQRSQMSMQFVAYEQSSTFDLTALSPDGRARRSLQYGLSRAVARELWTGEAATAAGWTDNLFLMGGSPNWTALTDAADDTEQFGYMTALAVLQRENARLGSGQGVIHASPLMVSLWDSGGALRVDGQRLRDLFGNLIVADGGYGFTAAPEGDDGDELAYEWAAVTGPVQVRLSDEELIGSDTEAINRRTNTFVQHVSRIANVIFDYTVHVGLRIAVDTANQLPS